MHLEIAGATNIGGRHVNEDEHGYDAALGLLAVAHGLSTRPAGRIAAESAIRALFGYLNDPKAPFFADPRERIERAFQHVHQRVREQADADEHLRGMATTLACAMEHGDLLVVGHVGAGRVLRFREGQVERLTTDQWLATALAVRSRLGQESPETYGPDTLTRGIGLGESLVPEVRVEMLLPNDGVLLATDGLTGVVDDDAICETLQRHRHPRSAVEALIRAAVRAQAQGNVTIVYGRWRPTIP